MDIESFLKNYTIKSGELSDTTSYAPMPWETMVHIFNEINKVLYLNGRRVADIGSGDLRVSLYGSSVIKANMYAIEKDHDISECSKRILRDAESYGIIRDKSSISFFPDTNVLDFQFDYHFDAIIFNYTEPKNWEEGIEFKERFIERTSWLRPGVLMAFLFVDAYLNLNKPITSFLDEVAECLIKERINGRTFMLYKKYVTPPVGTYLRPAYSHIKNKLGTGKVGILVGAYNGVSAEYVYYGLQPSKYYLVDPYVKYADLDGGYSYRQEAWDMARESLISKFGGKKDVVFIQKKSEETYVDFPDGYFDFVYIDADHSYGHVKLDMELWWPKVKAGGVMAGHDFQLIGHVDRAVREWSSGMGLEFHTKPCPWNSIPDWWIDKPGDKDAAKQ